MSANVTATIDSGSIKNVDINASAEITRSKLALETKQQPINKESLRIFDSATNAVLPNAAAGDDLGFVLGTLGTDAHSIQSSDSKAASVTQKARFTVVLGDNYEPGGTISIAVHAGMLTTVSDDTATIAFTAYAADEDDISHGSNLVTDSAKSINSISLSAKSFTVSPAGLVSGDELSVLMTIAVVDSSTGTAVIGLVSKIYLNTQVRG